MSIADNITREDFSYRKGGVELDLTAFGYDEKLPNQARGRNRSLNASSF